MTVTTEIDEYNIFDELWSGGRDTLNDLTVDDVRTVLEILDECSDGTMTLTDVNDFFWFERDTIAEWLGYADYDELMKDRAEERDA